MAPGGGGKRKRGDRTWSGDSSNDGGQRPSPHRPGNLNLAQQNQVQNQSYAREGQDSRGRGGRRPSRGNNRGSSARSPVNARSTMDPPSKAPSPTAPSQPRDQRTIKTSLPSNAVPPTPNSAPLDEIPASPQPQPPPFDYEYMIADNVQGWQNTGRRSVIDVGVGAMQEANVLLLSSLFQEVVRSALDHRISPTDAGTTIKDIIGTETTSEVAMGTHIDAQSLFLDTLSVLTDADISNARLPDLLFSTGIASVAMRQQLETPLLESLGLIRSTFARMGIRKQTNLLYRQANYNLLREESEGFAKLVTELFTTSANELPSSEVVEDTFERVKGMIGAFDLDVGRVLDITLDVFAAVLVKQYKFFVKFLRASSWWPKDDDYGRSKHKSLRVGGLPKWALPEFPGWSVSEADREDFSRHCESRDRAFWDRAREVGLRAFFEIGSRQISEEERQKLFPASSNTSSGVVDEARRWVEQTGTMPPKGNKIAAQLLGFKLRFYSSDARSPQDVLPDNLIYLSALLIKVGFISLHDLYPHLWRPDEEMELLRVERVKEKAERDRAAKPGAGLRNALLSAGALADDTVPAPLPARLRESEGRGTTPLKESEAEKSTTTAPEAKEALPEPADQKVSLLKSLLAIGAIPDALYILGRFPWLVELYPELPEYLHRIVHHSLSKLYSDLLPLGDRESLREQQRPTDSDQAGVPKGNIRLMEAPPRRVLRWAQLDKEDSPTDGQNYRYYWDDWSDTVPVCQSVDDMFIMCKSFMNLTGVKIGQDPGLLIKLARIGKDSLSKDKSKENVSRWSDLSKRLLVPALSITKGNAGVVNEVFELLSTFSRDTRFTIYTEWYSGQVSRLPDIKTAFDLAKSETRDVLKRISKTNLRPMGRLLAKIATSNPHIVINTAISQIESYDNLAEVVVECARYFTYLGYDVLIWSLISSLSRAGRSRVSGGGMNTSHWLTALALFTGKVFKRYSIMNPAPVLQYVGEQLRMGNSTDLIVLEQIVLFMAGVITDTNYNEAQLQAMAGGELLQSQTILQLQDKRHEARTTAKRLMKSLTESKLAGQLLLSIAQQRRTCIYVEDVSEAPLKLLGNIFDEIHRVLTQYLDLLRSNLSTQDFSASVPDVSQLIVEFGIEPEVAFWIGRPTVAQRMADFEKLAPDEVEKAKVDSRVPKNANGDLEMAEDGKGILDDGTETLTVDAEAPTPIPSSNPVSNGIASAGSPPPLAEMTSITSPQSSFSWHPVLQDIMAALEGGMRREIWETVGLAFYVTFWQLCLYDVHIPGKSYEDEIERQKKKVAAITNDRTHANSLEMKRKEQEKRQLADLQEKLLAENKRHLKSYSESRSRLQKEKDHWFSSMKSKPEELNLALIEHCFLPRLLLSPIDSFFCFKVIKFLHSNATPNFRTLGFFNLVFREDRLTSLIFLCSSKEADNLGRFLNEVLRDLGRWHADKALYEKEAYGPKRDLPGFAIKVDDDGKPAALLEFEDFRRILYRWHRMFHVAVRTCLTGNEYMHIRNAISVLKAVSQSFPSVNWVGKDLQKCVTALSESEQADIKVPSAALLGDLNRREKQWVFPHAFHLATQTAKRDQGNVTEKQKIESATNGTANGSQTPQPQQQALNAAATEFKPRIAPNGDGNENTTTLSKTEVEDGEVEDAEMLDVASKQAGQQTTLASSTDGPSIEVSKMDIDKPVPSEATQITDQSSQNANQATKAGHAAAVERPAPSAIASAITEVDASGAEPPKSVEPARIDGSRIPPRPDLRTSSSETAPPATLPKRPESGRATPVPSGNRSQTSLPNRPDIRPSLQNTRRGPAIDSVEQKRDGRDTRSPEYNRHSRQSDQDRERLYDQAGAHGSRSQDQRPPPERNGSYREAMDTDRPAEREHPARLPPDDRYGSRPPPRDMRPPMREPDWPDRSSRSRPTDPELYSGRQEQERFSRDPEGPPPRSTAAQQSDRGGINPERAALINNNGDSDRRPEPLRLNSEDRHNRGSRPSSPTPTDERRSHPRFDRREEGSLHDDRRGGSFSRGPNSRVDNVTTNLRGDRHGGPPPSYAAHDFPRDVRNGPPQQGNIDMSHGRLNQDTRFQGQQHDASDERYASPKDAPSGPRGRNAPARGGRSVPPLQPHINTQVASQNATSTSNMLERQPPTGPGGRSHTRNASQNEQPPTAPTSTPSTPAPETAGVHPERLGRISALSPSSSDFPRQPPAPMNQPAQGLSQSSPTSAVPPSGPRSTATLPSPTARGPPSGPAFPEGRGRGSRHPLAAVNNTLQQASAGPPERNGQGTTIRGRGAMRHGGGPPGPYSSGPPTPINQRSEAFPPQNPLSRDGGKPDLFANRFSAADEEPQRPPRLETEHRSASTRGGGRRGELVNEEAPDARRSTRHSSSRTHSQERERESSRHRRGEDSRRREDHHRDRDVSHREHENKQGGEPSDREHQFQRDGIDPNREEVGPSRRRDRRSEKNDFQGGGGGYDGRGPPPPPFSSGPHQGDRRYPAGSHGEDRDREHRDSRRESGPPTPLSGANANMGPRKRGRPPGSDEPQSGGYGGGMRVGSESKRPRRGQ